MKFVICINNKGFEASLELKKIYQVSSRNNESKLIQIVDETGEKYFYPEDQFVDVSFENKVQSQLEKLELN